jgi:DNA polymerase-3 subunit epsilon
MLIMAYDFETTGLPLFSEPSEDPRQPHFVQVGAALVDTAEDYRIVSSIDLIVRPEGWEIPADIAAIHGITTERAEQVGVSESLALDALLSLWYRADYRMGHNEQFDARIARIAILRFLTGAVADNWKAGAAICTAQLATPIVKAPPTDKMKAVGRHHYKTANLAESVLHFTGLPLENAHSAMADVLGCIAVYRAINEHSANQNQGTANV